MAAACLYIVCRQDAKPFMLIDFSDALQINVFTLGAVFLQLCKVLRLENNSMFSKCARLAPRTAPARVPASETSCVPIQVKLVHPWEGEPDAVNTLGSCLLARPPAAKMHAPEPRVSQLCNHECDWSFPWLTRHVRDPPAAGCQAQR